MWPWGAGYGEGRTGDGQKPYLLMPILASRSLGLPLTAMVTVFLRPAN